MAELSDASVENYLKEIYRLSLDEVPVKTSRLAEALTLSPAAVTEMVKRLSEQELLSYRRYHGVALTDQGRKRALLVVRRHRLWELFLYQVLNVPWPQVHQHAERLEHATDDRLAAYLDRFLGRPTIDPHGHPIPDAEGKVNEIDRLRLDAVPSGTRALILQCTHDGDVELMKYLSRLGLVPGASVTVGERAPFFDGASSDGSKVGRSVVEHRCPAFLEREVSTALALPGRSRKIVKEGAMTAAITARRGPRPVNRAHIFAPSGAIGFQDKQIMTRFETDPWNVVPGGELKVFDTTIGKIGVLICYDSEFPLLGKALEACDVILTPSCTEQLSGYWRVRVGSMARALENQCVVAMASLVGTAEWSEAVDMNTGMGGIFGPPDTGFPDTGVIAEGTLNQPGWTYGDVDLQTIAAVRETGRVRNRWDWANQLGRDSQVTNQILR